jgi:ATP-dependent protease ClpP protease subunit
MTIHPVRMNGLVVGVPQSFRYFSDMQERIVKFVCSHSSVKEEKLKELMMCPDQLATDVGSVVEGREAVRIGLIDEIGGLDRALTVLRGMMSGKTMD